MIKAKIKNEEQDKYNEERIIDINLILQYMETLDITKEYFTEIGEGHLRGLASVQDEIKFVSKETVSKMYEERQMYKEAMVEYKVELSELESKYDDVVKENNRLKKSWFKRLFK